MTAAAAEVGQRRAGLDTVQHTAGPIVAGILVAAAGYVRMFQVMAAVSLTMAVAFAVASRIGVAGRVVPRT